MLKTPFAGLTSLDPGDPLSLDGYSFQSRNPVIIDQLLRLGVIAHKHDAHAALVHHSPGIDPTVAVVDTGGTIPADLSIYVGYTLIDADGGETVLNDNVQVVTTQAGLVPPDSAPLLASDHDAGTLLADSYTYGVTVADGVGGETTMSPTETITIDPGYPNSEITISGLSDIVTEAGGTEWRLWKMVGAGQWGLIETGTTDEVLDDGSLASDCTVTPPLDTSGGTMATSKLQVTVPATDQPAEAVSFRVYASIDGDFTSPALLGTYPVADLGTMKQYTSLTLGAGAPPEVTTAYGGADKIDPDTDMLDFPWKRPVANLAALPATGNDDGDIRETLNDHALHAWTGSAWVAVGGGGSSTDLTKIPGGTLVQWVRSGDNTWPLAYLTTPDNPQTGVTYTEDFSVNHLADYTIAMVSGGGSGSDFTVGSGKLSSAAAGYANITLNGHDFQNGTFDVKIDIADNNWNLGVGLISGTKMVKVYSDSGDANLRVRSENSSGDTWSQSVAWTRPTSGSVWLRIVKSGSNGRTVVVSAYSADPNVGSPTPLATVPLTIPNGHGIKLGGTLLLRFGGNTSAATTSAVDYVRVTAATSHNLQQLKAVVYDRDFNPVQKIILDETGASDFAFKAQEAVQAIPLDAAWSTYSGTFGSDPEVWKDSLGYVRLRGQAKKSSAPSAGDVIGTLPANYRPPAIIPRTVVSGDGTTARVVGYVDIEPDGDIIWRGGASAGTNPWISLEGIQFRT
jgi:hypothetical protein